MSMFAEVSRDDQQIVPRTHNKKGARRIVYVSFGERLVKVEEGERLDYCSIRADRFCRKCEECRAQQPPPPTRIIFEKRPPWNGVITRLAPVIRGDPAVSVQTRK